MRSVFTVDITTSEGKYPTNEEMLGFVRRFGWEPSEVGQLPDEESKRVYYKEQASSLFEKMPEIAKAEKGHVIFYGFLADDQTHIVVTRRVIGQFTFRLLHEDLPKLQDSTVKIVRKILSSSMADMSLNISNLRVEIYEHKEDRVIIEGRVIPNSLRETVRTDRKDVLLFVGPLILMGPLLIGIVNVDPSNEFVSGTMERLSTALITTALVSALGFFQNYYEIRRSKLIAWTGVSQKT